MRGDLDDGAQGVRGEPGRQARKAGAHVASFDVVVVGEEWLPVHARRPRLRAAGFVQAFVAELDARAGPLVQDACGRLPEGARLLGLAGFGQKLADRVEHDRDVMDSLAGYRVPRSSRGRTR